MKIKYVPNFKKTGTEFYTIKIILNGNRNEHDAFHINTKTFIQDIKKSKKRLISVLETIDTKNYIVNLSQSIINLENVTTIQNIIWQFLKSFLPWKHEVDTCVYLTHDGEKTHNNIVEIISQIEKIRDARILAMTPANLAFPSAMTNHFKDIFSKVPNIKIDIFDHKTLKKKGFELILAIGNSASNKPQMMIIERKGKNSNSPKICIVGKGITFDTGGLAIKSVRNMIDMKFDKIGAIYGSYALLHLLEDPMYKDYTFIGLFPFAENAVSSHATRPGDVYKSYLGKTVEITDPDAEGRLVLADAFGYCHKYKPDLIVDIATLTGHADSINCWHHGYYYATPDILKDAVEKITYEIGEAMLPMPTWTDHDDILESNVADLVNDPINCSDAFTAALFLKQFIPKNTDWLHIDLSHEFDNHIPRGNGIQTIISVIRYWIEHNKPKQK
jgi:leucyl aminopeptidase